MKKLNWVDFQSELKEKGVEVFSASDIVGIFGVSGRSASAFINYHLSKGSVIKARKNLYFLKDNIPPDFFLAGAIYQPSYISLETALSYYSLIPEIVYSVTSVTTRKTARFETLGKEFIYRKIKKSAFSGYYLKKEGGEIFNIAYPEKAMTDYLYFCFLGEKRIPERIELEKIDERKVSSFAECFKNRAFSVFVKNFFKKYANR